MNKSKIYIYLLSLLATGFLFSSCEKDESEIKTDLLYDVTVEGNEVTFTVKTKGVSGYRWEFGDGESSTDANPTHVYPGKGKYVPTLFATVDGKTVEASTVLRIAKTTPVKIDDKTLEDWAAVTNSVSLGAKKGVFNEVKLDYDGNYVYVYIDMVGKKANEDIFDFYIDSDNNASTGLLTGTFTGGGYDILLEGPLFGDGMSIFYHNSADQNAFSFAEQIIAEAYQVGTAIETGANLKFEMRIARGKLKGLTGSGLRIAIQAIKSDWSATLGSAPDDGTSSVLLDMSE